VEAYQWFLFGIMVAWTPSLVVLAVMLCGKLIHQKCTPKMPPGFETGVDADG